MKKARVKRKTMETDIKMELSLKSGKNSIKTPFAFFSHMLNEFAWHGGFLIKTQIKGDTDVDAHHTIEDAGICLGEAIKKLIGNGKGINRFGWAIVPMDDALVIVAVDLSGRPFLNFKVRFSEIRKADFDYRLFEDFFKAVSDRSSINLHIVLIDGKNNHHISEAIFKGFGIALRMALSRKGKKIPSTKGKI